MIRKTVTVETSRGEASFTVDKEGVHIELSGDLNEGQLTLEDWREVVTTIDQLILPKHVFRIGC